MTETNPFKAGSRKAKIYDVFKAEGLDAAYKEAERLQIKVGTMKSWSGSWAKGTLPKDKVAKADATEKVKPNKSATNETYNAHFKYTTRKHAELALSDLCKRSGLRKHAFHIIENDERFAVVPAHYQSDKGVPQFNKGDVVFDACARNSKARVIEPGPEQTMIRYERESVVPGLIRPREDCLPNCYLVKLPETTAKEPRRKS